MVCTEAGERRGRAPDNRPRPPKPSAVPEPGVADECAPFEAVTPLLTATAQTNPSKRPSARAGTRRQWSTAQKRRTPGRRRRRRGALSWKTKRRAPFALCLQPFRPLFAGRAFVPVVQCRLAVCAGCVHCICSEWASRPQHFRTVRRLNTKTHSPTEQSAQQIGREGARRMFGLPQLPEDAAAALPGGPKAKEKVGPPFSSPLFVVMMLPLRKSTRPRTHQATPPAAAQNDQRLTSPPYPPPNTRRAGRAAGAGAV